MLFISMFELNKTIKESTMDFNGKIMVTNEKILKEENVQEILQNAIFNEKEEVKIGARVLLKDLANSMGIKPASIQKLYEAMGRGEEKGFTVPAINIRGLTYETARAIFRSMAKLKVGPVLFEIAKSEIEYTEQRPSEYSVIIIAAAIREGYKGPVFMQGDHFQINAKKFNEDPNAEIGSLRVLIKEAMEAGFKNIDIDASTLVDLSWPEVTDQQRPNYETTATLTEYIRSLEGINDTVSVGGEIGEVGKKNSTEEELRAFMDGFNKSIGEGKTGISKISIQTGTSHGGIPLPDGSIAEVSLDFDTIERLGKVSREEYGLGGVVQHGASTLPDESFHIFPEKGAAEVHLATGFQNLLLDSPNFPAKVKRDIYNYLNLKLNHERSEGQTDEQFYYKTRKKCFGPFKEALWRIDEEVKEKIGEELEARFDMLFTSLNVTDTAEILKKYID
ncbi:MAG: class II fructose-bisphosphate aldolase [Proteobacteria bacterium]|nr:class II fructose-bisphosphate aldolase [Pseudomonadota bacterium]